MTATVIRNAEWVVAWDGEENCHVYLHGVDVAWRDGVIIHVGAAVVFLPVIKQLVAVIGAP